MWTPRRWEQPPTDAPVGPVTAAPRWPARSAGVTPRPPEGCRCPGTPAPAARCPVTRPLPPGRGKAAGPGRDRRGRGGGHARTSARRRDVTPGRRRRGRGEVRLYGAAGGAAGTGPGAAGTGPGLAAGGGHGLRLATGLCGRGVSVCRPRRGSPEAGPGEGSSARLGGDGRGRGSPQLPVLSLTGS